jgi:hypothetical protein
MFESMNVLNEAGRAHESLARLAAAIGPDMSGAVADEVLAELLEIGRQADLAICRAIERADRSGQFAADGAASTHQYVCRKVNERAGWASKRIAAGRALADRLPMTAKSWEAGRLGLDHAHVIDVATRRIEDPKVVAELDRILAEAAANGLDPTDLEKIADQFRAQTVPEQAEEKARRQHRDQSIHASTSLGGMVHISGWLDPEAGAAFQRALGFFTPPPPPKDQLLADPANFEPVAYRRALGLHQLVRHAMAHAEGCNGEGGAHGPMIIGVDLETLQAGVGTGQIAGGPSLSAGALRRLACDAAIIPAVLGSNGELLDLGRKTRNPCAALRAAVIARDGGCIFPGCRRPPAWCECHHRRHWLLGGLTNLENLDLLCVRHHHLCHEGGWRLTVDTNAERTPWFHPPSGQPPLKGERRPLIPPRYRK